MKFEEFNISDSLKQAIREKGFEKPSDVQEQVIPVALHGKDLVGKSKTGTGKTAAFAIPLIENIRRGQTFSALIITPTRELAIQVKTEIASLSNSSGIKVVAVFGGESVQKQIGLLKIKPEIIVGTPGRLLDFIGRGNLDFSKAGFLILDEADRMFDMGFRDDIEKIIGSFPRERQTMLFSATMPETIKDMVDRHLKEDKIFFNLSEDDSPVDEVEQYYIMLNRNQKIDALQDIINWDNNVKTLVFCRTKRTVDWLEKQLSRRRINAIALHGDKRQSARNAILNKFKNMQGGVLIATDIVARGIHVDNIGHVVNFDALDETETYLHRIGRTARQGKRGIAVSLCSNVMELENLERIGRQINAEISELR